MNRFGNHVLRMALSCILICIIPGFFITAAAGADISYEGYLGDTIILHASSYDSNQVYLFMTGPGLPGNGVTLTDTTQRADQGQFTIVDVGSNQQWSMTWETSRIQSRIDPGTYTVYVVNSPVDKSQLAGHSYQTLSVYLKDPGSQISFPGGTSYTMNPEAHVETSTSLPTTATTVVTPTPTVTILSPSPFPSPVPSATTTRPASSSVLVVIAGIGMVGLFFCRMRHQW